MDYPASSANELEFLAKVTRLWTEPDLEHALREVIRLTANAVGAVRGSLFLRRQTESSLTNFIVGQDTYLPPEPQEVVEAILRDGLAGWVLTHGTGTIVHDTSTDGRWKQFSDTRHQAQSAVSVPFAYGEDLLGVITLVHDQPDYFTERHLQLMNVITGQVALAVHNASAFQQITMQRAQLEAVLHAIPDLLLVLNGNHEVELVSDAVSALLQGTGSSGAAETFTLTGKPLRNLESYNSIFGIIHQVLDQAERREDDWSFEARSEETGRDYFIHILPRQLTATQEPGYIIVMNDVSALRDLSRFKDQVLRTVSHDLRTPLVVIIGYADLLTEDLATDPVLSQYAAGIVQAAERMDEMLNNMLRAREVHLSPGELYEVVNLKALILDVLRDLRPLAARKHIQLMSSFRDDRVALTKGDPVMLAQAMSNYVSNAIKYTNDGGQVEIQAYNDETRFYYLVKDNGVGIRADEVSHVFDSYFRGSKTETHPDEGLGIGLSLVKTIVQQHGGEVWVDSEEGVGSVFGFWLPIA